MRVEGWEGLALVGFGSGAWFGFKLVLSYYPALKTIHVCAC